VRIREQRPLRQIRQELARDPKVRRFKTFRKAVTDSAIVCRLKFTAKPARSSWVQRDTLKRVYATLEAEVLRFTSNAVTVRAADADRPMSSFAVAAVRRESCHPNGARDTFQTR